MTAILSLESTNDFLTKDIKAGHRAIARGAFMMADAMIEEGKKG